MKDGFIKVAAGKPELFLADIKKNTKGIKEIISEAEDNGVKLLVLPELCITGYSCMDLFFNTALLEGSITALKEITDFTQNITCITVLGLPILHNSMLYNSAAVIYKGEILGIIPKTYIPNHGETNEKRYFDTALNLPADSVINIDGKNIPFGNDLIFYAENLREFSFAAEICEDLFAPTPQNAKLSLGGANIIVNSAACNQIIGKLDKLKLMLEDTSLRLNCGYILSSADIGESTTDTVFAGLRMIAENGITVAALPSFSNQKLLVTEIDVKKLDSLKIENTSFIPNGNFRKIAFRTEICDTEITRQIPKNPFIGTNDIGLTCCEALEIQSHALARRISHIGAKKAVIGISGGLDSTLALLVCVRALRLLDRPLSDILAITLPCFGTTTRTRSNSEILCNELETDFKEINIKNAVNRHFEDIGQPDGIFDITYENSQARERTQVLMDIANKENGIVVGTGDLSELALGWATYNGDHMSMYSVNSGIPKTLVRALVKYEADNSEGRLKRVLLDILDTPVSPELLPSDLRGDISQKTEDLVGPYELHDFFIYNMLKYKFSPKKLFRLATIAFPEYQKQTVLKWLNIFLKRFFTQQFKRSCLPDGPKVFDISLSPRSDLKMPTDAFASLWLKELEDIEI